MIYSSLLSVRMINSGYSGYMSGSVLEHTHDMHNGSMPTKTLGLIFGGSLYCSWMGENISTSDSPVFSVFDHWLAICFVEYVGNIPEHPILITINIFPKKISILILLKIKVNINIKLMLLKLQNQYKKLDQIPLSIDIHFDFYTHFPLFLYWFWSLQNQYFILILKPPKSIFYIDFVVGFWHGFGVW